VTLHIVYENDLISIQNQGLHSGVEVTVYVWVLSKYSGSLPFLRHVRLIGDCTLSLGASVHGGVSRLWPCDGLVTHPGCTPPLTQWQLG